MEKYNKKKKKRCSHLEEVKHPFFFLVNIQHYVECKARGEGIIARNAVSWNLKYAHSTARTFDHTLP